MAKGKTTKKKTVPMYMTVPSVFIPKELRVKEPNKLKLFKSEGARGLYLRGRRLQRMRYYLGAVQHWICKEGMKHADAVVKLKKDFVDARMTAAESSNLPTL